MADNRRYIVVDKKKLRRHSAPEAPVLFIPRRRNQFTIENWCRASVSDFSTLFERQSESCSSLELDTSNLSADLTPVPTPKSSLVGSYMNLPGFEDIRCEVAAGNYSHCAIFGTWYLWKNLIFSQLVAACLAIMIICNDKIQEEKHPIINGQNLPQYVLLSILWTTQLALRNHGRDIVEIIRYSGLRYLCLSVLHVEINYLTLSSLRYGCSVGNQMIDCVAASLSLVIAYVLLEVQLHTTHILGFVIAVTSSLGFSLFIESDSKSHPGSEILLGNVLRIASGICLACNSVAQEMIVKATGCIEYLGMIGLIGSLICGLQVYDSNFLPSGTLEMTSETSGRLPTSWSYWFNMIIYSVTQFSFYSLTSKILRNGCATGLHLALLSSGFYTHFLSFFLYGRDFDFLQIFFCLATIVGSLLFSAKRTPIGIQYCFPIKIVVTKSG